MHTPVVTWHFCSNDRKLGYGDGREVRRGVVHTVAGLPKLCRHGLHGSLRAIDALEYAPGTIVSRCEHRGTILIGSDKLVSSEREYVAVADGTFVLVEFARWCVKRAAAAADARYADAARYAADAAAADARYADAARYAAAAARYAAARYAAADAAEREAQNDWLEARLFDLIQQHAAAP